MAQPHPCGLESPASGPRSSSITWGQVTIAVSLCRRLPAGGALGLGGEAAQVISVHNRFEKHSPALLSPA